MTVEESECTFLKGHTCRPEEAFQPAASSAALVSLAVAAAAHAKVRVEVAATATSKANEGCKQELKGRNAMIFFHDSEHQ